MPVGTGFVVNDDERGLHQVYDDWPEQPAPYEPIDRYHHNRPVRHALSLALNEGKGKPKRQQ